MLDREALDGMEWWIRCEKDDRSYVHCSERFMYIIISPLLVLHICTIEA